MPKNRGFYGFVKGGRPKELKTKNNERGKTMAQKTARIYRGQDVDYTGFTDKYFENTHSFNPMDISIRSIDFGGYKINKAGSLYRLVHGVGTFILNNITELYQASKYIGISVKELEDNMALLDKVGV